MKKIYIITAAMVALTGCTPLTTMQNKVEAKAADKLIGNKLGVSSLKKETTTKEKVMDVASGKTTVSDAVTDKVADIAVSKVL